MTVAHDINGGTPVPQSRRPYGSYRHTIESRAVRAVDLVESGVSIKEVAAALCVCPFYVRLACNLSIADLLRLDSGELTLAEVARDYRQRLAERRAQREQAERDELQREAEAAHELHAEWEAEQGRVKRFANGNATPTLSDDVVENFVTEVGVDRVSRVVEKLTQPEFPFAEAAE